MRKIKYVVYIVIVVCILLIPLAGMSFWPTNETTENTVLAEWPKLSEDGKWNQNYLADLGEYFEDHFAFRQNFVTTNALLYGKMLGSSATDQVVVGSDDWLYYGGTLDDYQGKDLLSEREMYAIVHNLKVVQDYVESQGSRFLLTIAPNKNSLYGDNMPYYYLGGEESNLNLLTEKLEVAGINYLDLYELFEEQDEVLYFKRDSHWNNKGALLAYNAIMNNFGKEHETYLNVPYSIEKIHSGDLDEMLYPLAVELEDEYIYDKNREYSCVTEVVDNMDNWIETENVNKQGKLLMFRDSFGESLLPFMAEEFEKGYFTRLVPYNLTQVEQYDTDYVVIERVERRLSAFAEEAPIMNALESQNVIGLEAKTDTTLEVEKQASYIMINGQIDERYVDEDTEIFVAIRDNNTLETKTYIPFYTITKNGDGNGYQMYLNENLFPTSSSVHVNIIVQNKGENMIVASNDITLN